MKINSKKSLKAILAAIMISSSSVAFAADGFSVGADLVSSYVWRGVNQDLTPGTKQSPNIQPYATYTLGGLTVGAWGSTSITGTIKEFDLYATYAITDKFSATLTDYNWNFSGLSYFKYTGVTDHVYEATIGYAGTESLPLSASINTVIGGFDKNSKGKQAYSTYLELGYQVCDAAKLVVGASLIDDTPLYSGAGITNVSLKVTKSIELSDKFSLPVYGVAGFNTVAKDAFLVFGISL